MSADKQHSTKSGKFKIQTAGDIGDASSNDPLEVEVELINGGNPVAGATDPAKQAEHDSIYSKANWIALEANFRHPSLSTEEGSIDQNAVEDLALDMIGQIAVGNISGVLVTPNDDHIASWTVREESANAEAAAKAVSEAAAKPTESTTPSNFDNYADAILGGLGPNTQVGDFIARALLFEGGEKYVVDFIAKLASALEAGPGSRFEFSVDHFAAGRLLEAIKVGEEPEESEYAAANNCLLLGQLALAKHDFDLGTSLGELFAGLEIAVVANGVTKATGSEGFADATVDVTVDVTVEQANADNESEEV